MQTQTDLFNEPQRIIINGNPLLQAIANHILVLVQRNPSLIDGDTVGDINRRVTLAIYYDNGLVPILQSGSKEQFTQWFMNRKLVHTEEEIARALRYLVQNDHIRLSKKVLDAAEQHRQRIARSVKA